MKKCGYCGFSTANHSYEYCYLCGTKLERVPILPSHSKPAQPARYFKCEKCGVMADFYMDRCIHCGGRIIALTKPDIPITPPENIRRLGEVKRCTRCSYYTENLSYNVCPKCSYPLAVAFADTPHTYPLRYEDMPLSYKLEKNTDNREQPKTVQWETDKENIEQPNQRNDL